MKNILVFMLGLCLLVHVASAQVQTSNPQDIPRLISYQGVLNQNDSLAPNGNYSISVTLYADPQGEGRVWQDNFTTTVTKGVFGILLGSGANPLPSSNILNRQLWVGVQINGQPEMRPLTQLSATPYALNVADNSISTSKIQEGAITASKIGTEYIPYLRLEGRKINSFQNPIDFEAGDNIRLEYDSISHAIILNADFRQITKKEDNLWVGGGTSNYAGLDALLNTVAGGFADTALPSKALPGYASIIGGEGNKVTGTWSTIGGGDTNLIYQGLGAFIGGGLSNHDTGSYAVIGGGEYNGAHGDRDIIVGGSYNYVGAQGAAIVGGDSNLIDAPSSESYNQSFIGAGVGNRIVPDADGEEAQSVIGGGKHNTVYEGPSFIGGGEYNIVAQEDAAVVAGGRNSDSLDYGFIGAGEYNRLLSTEALGSIFGIDPTGASAIVAGRQNTASANLDFIGSGYLNSAIEDLATIPGGVALKLGAYSFGFNGDSLVLAPTITDLSASGAAFRHIAYFGNVDLLLGNVDGKAKAMRFYANNTDHTYATSIYSSFQAAGSQAANIEYILPSSLPSTGQVLTALAVSAPVVTLSWQTPSGGGGGGNAWLVTGNTLESPGPKFLGTIDDSAFEIHVYDGGPANQGDRRVMRFDPNPTSANITGGFSGNQITNAVGSVIAGGGELGSTNRVSDSFAVVGGGAFNIADTGAAYSVVAGGHKNYVQGPYSVISGGDIDSIRNIAADHNVIVGGFYNIEDNPSFGVIVGGQRNYLDTDAWTSVLVGGDTNVVRSPLSFVGGGHNNGVQRWSYYSAIVGGENNQTYGSQAFIGGGDSNFSWGQYSAIVGGRSNLLDGLYGFLGGGDSNTISWNADYSTIGGGDSNVILGRRSFIGGGCHNQVSTTLWGTIVAGCGNVVSDSFTFIGGGVHNNVSANSGTIGGGDSNTISLLAGNSTKPFAGTIAGGGGNNIGAGPFAGVDGFFLPVYATIGGGQFDNVTGHFGVVSGGVDNSSYGKYATIPGGRGLIAFDYQTVIGRLNDNITFPSPGTTNYGDPTTVPLFRGATTFTGAETLLPPDAPIFIIGNGGFSKPGSSLVTNRSNAFIVSDDGHSVVYDVNGGLSSGTPPRPPYYGGTYADNTIAAWGDIPVNAPSMIPYHATADFGVLQVLHPYTGIFLITLKSVQSDGITPVNFSKASVTVTLEDDTLRLEDTSIVGCGSVTATRISTISLQPNSFIVRTYGGPASPCDRADRPFFFKVCARP